MGQRPGALRAIIVYLGGIGTPYTVCYKGGLLVPIESHLILSEAVDKTKWFQSKYHFADDDGPARRSRSRIGQEDLTTKSTRKHKRRCAPGLGTGEFNRKERKTRGGDFHHEVIHVLAHAHGT
ncbi:MAG: hypothetical protein FJ145_25320 [Deltaproteobacteria bacterium]|nr:hypothetical protein [Deltaproteobacteria bacterium]